MRRLLARFVVDERGATAIEYAIIAAGISICIVTIVNGMGSALSTKFVEVGASIKKPKFGGPHHSAAAARAPRQAGQGTAFDAG